MQRTWLIGTFIRGAAAGFFAAMAIYLHTVPALAMDSTGGSIGNQDSQDGSVRSAHQERSKPRERERLARNERPSRNGGRNFDGVWNSASFGRTCPERTTDVVTISGGEMLGTGFAGRVSGNGSVSGVWSGAGLAATITGRMSGSRGSGTFLRSDGCVGTWVLDRAD
jgi:hypothetical protein